MKARQKRLQRARARGMESVPLPASSVAPAPRETTPPPAPWRPARYRRMTTPLVVSLAVLLIWLLVKLAFALRRSF